MFLDRHSDQFLCLSAFGIDDGMNQFIADYFGIAMGTRSVSLFVQLPLYLRVA